MFLVLTITILASLIMLFRLLAEAKTLEPAENAQSTSFSANGRGIIRIEPDMASIEIGVVVSKPTAGEAADENSLLMNTVLEAVKEQGIDEKDIATSHYNIRPRYDYNGKTPELVDCEASNTVTITVRDLSKLAGVLDAAVAAGANDISRISFDKADKKDACDQALAAAVESAAHKITVMAQAAGLEGTPVPHQISEASYSVAPVYQLYEASLEKVGGNVPIESGQLVVTAEVNVTYTIGDN